MYQDYQKNTMSVSSDIAGTTLLKAANACIANHRKYPWVVRTEAGGRFINPLNMGIWARIMASYGMRDEKFTWDNVSHLYSSFRLTDDVTYGLNQVTPLIISTRIPFGKTKVNGPRLSLAAYAFSVDGFLDVWLGAPPLDVQSSKKPTANLADKIMAGIDTGKVILYGFLWGFVVIVSVFFFLKKKMQRHRPLSFRTSIRLLPSANLDQTVTICRMETSTMYTRRTSNVLDMMVYIPHLSLSV